MDIVNIEASTFERMLEKVQALCSLIENTAERNKHKILGEWMDNQEVCQMLGISPRKLQFLRESGKVAYSRIDRRIFYKKEDITHYMNHRLKRIGK